MHSRILILSSMLSTSVLASDEKKKCAMVTLAIDESFSMAEEHEWLSQSDTITAVFEGLADSGEFSATNMVCLTGFGGAVASVSTTLTGITDYGCRFWAGNGAANWAQLLSSPPGTLEFGVLGALSGIDLANAFIDSKANLLSANCESVKKMLLLFTDADNTRLIQIFDDKKVAELKTKLIDEEWIFNAVLNVEPEIINQTFPVIGFTNTSDAIYANDMDGNFAVTQTGGFFPEDGTVDEICFIEYVQCQYPWWCLFTTCNPANYCQAKEVCVNDANGIVNDYGPIAWMTGGAVFNINLLENSGYKRDAFTNAFVQTKIKELCPPDIGPDDCSEDCDAQGLVCEAPTCKIAPDEPCTPNEEPECISACECVAQTSRKLLYGGLGFVCGNCNIPPLP